MSTARSEELRALCEARKLPLHGFDWSEGIARTGLRHSAVYLVRPDGYLGLVDAEGRAASLGSYLDRHKGAFRVPHTDGASFLEPRAAGESS
jgi:hypothetical protein